MSLFYSASWQLIIRVLTIFFFFLQTCCSVGEGGGALQIAFRKSRQPASLLSMHHASKQQLRIAFQTDPPTLTVPTLSGRQLFPRPPLPPSAPVVQSLDLSLSRTARSGSLHLCLYLLPATTMRSTLDAWSVKQSTRPLWPLSLAPPLPRLVPFHLAPAIPIPSRHSILSLFFDRGEPIHIQPAP